MSKEKNIPKYSSRYHIEKEIDIIMNKLYIINQNFQLFKTLKSEENIKYICNEFPYTFSIILNSLFNITLLELSKLVGDFDCNSISINDLYNKYSKNKQLFKEKKHYYVREINTDKKYRRNFEFEKLDTSMNTLKEDLDKSNKKIQYLRKRRNKSIAHNDKKMMFDTKNKYYKGIVAYSDIDDFISLLIKDINRISQALFGKRYAFSYNQESEVNCLRDILKKGINYE